MAGILTLSALGASLSVDAFAAALGKGAANRNVRWWDAARVGMVFGLFEALTPAIGWLLGYLVNDWIADWDHWVAFVLLAIVGGHMVRQSLSVDAAEAAEAAPMEARPNYWRLSLTAIATSIDAAAVGITLALMEVNLWVACLIIGGITAVVATGGVILGQRVGPYLGRYAGIVGGLVLFAIGGSILVQHLSA
ncbi:manganese efflux pump MntP [Sphingomonas sp.]|uniref:manganese efflux pump MntP n=1 Tax=Sphingomonas sp. TaxID=28214 RepID=UPI002DD665CD|nr:manganese efflux pump MntP family protein [Sphingomonas sp.]